MAMIMYAIKKMESDGTFNPSTEIGGAQYLSDWTHVKITTIDGEEVNKKTSGINIPTNVILNNGYIILEYK